MYHSVPKDTFRGNAHHVTHLQIKNAGQVAPYGLHCTNLCDLTLPADLRPQQHGGSLVELIQKNKNTLRSLKMGMRLVRPPLLLQAIDGTRHLRKIELDIRFPLDSLAEFVYQLLGASPQLEHLAISCAFDFYVPLLRQCPNLVRLRLPPLPSWLLPDLHDYLRQVDREPVPTTLTPLPNKNGSITPCHHQRRHGQQPIESMDLSALVTYKDANFAEILEACPRNTLKEINLHQRIVGRQTAQAILRHSQSLVRLNMLNITGPIESQWIQTLLASCAKLESVKIRSMQPDLVYLHADHILEGLATGQGWACQQLQDIQVPIGGLCLPLEQPLRTFAYPSIPVGVSPSPHHNGMNSLPATAFGNCVVFDEHDGDGGDHNVLWAACRSADHGTICLGQHRRVFEQLGQLKQLRLLNVARGLFRGPTVPDWLDWRLSSGFGHLRSLTSLEELVLQREAMLDPVELEWMKDQWPRCAIFNHFG
ncbi:hypothetical protein DFQ26_004206 [Actinomortierella ambigua]|nr:hypothetical protein DFQ26_004206 [Actinomortierella ambigua]